MFINTLDITERFYRTAIDKDATKTGVAQKDARGRAPTAKHIIDKERRRLALEHLKTFEVLESHYARKNSSKLYHDSALNIMEMYRLYKAAPEFHLDNNPVCETVYRECYHELNLSRHIPSKDRCKICDQWSELEESQQTDHMGDDLGYWQHIENHEAVQARQKKDEALCKVDPTVVVANFDLEQVLNLPQSNVQQSYYTRNFHCYNFTVWNFRDRDCVCHMWTQLDGERGSDEMASCLYDWIMKLQEGVKQVVFYCDKCAGQNR